MRNPMVFNWVDVVVYLALCINHSIGMLCSDHSALKGEDSPHFLFFLTFATLYLANRGLPFWHGLSQITSYSASIIAPQFPFYGPFLLPHQQPVNGSHTPSFLVTSPSIGWQLWTCMRWLTTYLIAILSRYWWASIDEKVLTISLQSCWNPMRIIGKRGT